jgi:hypothetical protein
MKRLFGLLLLAGVIYGGYLYYRQAHTLRSRQSISSLAPGNQLVITQVNNKLGDLASVLGASIQNVLDNGQSMLSSATGGASEPIINQLVTNTQNTLKDLPQKEAEKIKYEFCKGVVTNYESSKGVAP